MIEHQAWPTKRASKVEFRPLASHIRLNDEILTRHLTLNYPSNLNALSATLVDQLCAVLHRLDDAREGVAAIVLTGARSFSSGFDIAELEELPSTSAVEKLNNFLAMIEGLSVPVIAAVSGIAFGGGCELALACDVIYATADARFALPEVNLGLIPAGGGLRLLSKLVGPGRAADLILTGREWTGVEAERWGIATRCFEDPDSCLEGAIQCAERIAANDFRAVRAARRLMRASRHAATSDVMRMELREFEDLLGSEGHIERRTAWLNRRKAKKSGANSP
ncbi:enoyl-hydratase isomerase family protein [Colletotrichum musicola]|uniref:Enoyl-hydratase isomerase family protein n=1 Tax=Colletotrichum musicola TaxID=2175873 RepID=A0A8H6JIU4_9PEZI|nr:enoyl-hydratase isomerase family protein [Colletotrichum musicola]